MKEFSTKDKKQLLLQLLDTYSDDACQFTYDQRVVPYKIVKKMITTAFRLGANLHKVEDDYYMQKLLLEQEIEEQLKAAEDEYFKAADEDYQEPEEEEDDSFDKLLEEYDIEDPYSYDYSEN